MGYTQTYAYTNLSLSRVHISIFYTVGYTHKQTHTPHSTAHVHHVSVFYRHTHVRYLQGDRAWVQLCAFNTETAHLTAFVIFLQLSVFKTLVNGLFVFFCHNLAL